ncbi:MAG: CHAT domain-containing protein [Cyanobacteria bacterium P01_G01_bin.54]
MLRNVNFDLYIPDSSSPIDIAFRIEKRGDYYMIYVVVPEFPDKEFRVKATLDDIENLSRNLQDSIETISGYCEDRQPEPEEIRGLVKLGYKAFRVIFDKSDVWDYVKDWMHSKSNVKVAIDSKQFTLPWELISHKNYDKTFSYQHFWGMRYQVYRRVEPPMGKLPSMQESLDKVLRVGMLANHELEKVSKEEIPFLQGLQKDGKISLSILPKEEGVELEDIEDLRDFFGTDFNIVHFACHAHYKEKNPPLSCFKLSSGFELTLQDLETEDVSFEGSPLAILNACNTSVVDPRYTSNFINALLDLGACGVITTECSVPDLFAAQFIKQLYTNLLGGLSLGESLLKSRKHFLQYDNPSGLLYSMYGSPSIRLVSQEIS